MTTAKRDPSTKSATKVLMDLAHLSADIERANVALGDYLLDLVETEQWTQLSWAEIAQNMGVTRQAVQQRVARLLANGARRRARATGVSPDQSSLDDLIDEATRAIPPAKGRKR